MGSRWGDSDQAGRRGVTMRIMERGKFLSAVVTPTQRKQDVTASQKKRYQVMQLTQTKIMG